MTVIALRDITVAYEESCKAWVFPILFCWFVYFENRDSLCSHGYFGTCYVDQAFLELRDPPASAAHLAFFFF